MKKTDLIQTALRFTQPLNLDLHPRRETRPGITRPFFETPRRPAQHDMLLLNTHPELLPTPELAPPRDLTFFNFDRP
jgi:hypothetical protein